MRDFLFVVVARLVTLVVLLSGLLILCWNGRQFVNKERREGVSTKFKSPQSKKLL